jgi:hypothetical protein
MPDVGDAAIASLVNDWLVSRTRLQVVEADKPPVPASAVSPIASAELRFKVSNAMTLIGRNKTTNLSNLLTKLVLHFDCSLPPHPYAPVAFNPPVCFSSCFLSHPLYFVSYTLHLRPKW